MPDNSVRRTFWDTPTLNSVSNGLDRAAARHRALAANIANVNTPNYKRQDVQFEAALNKALLPIKADNPRHIAVLPANGPSPAQAATATMRLDGNTVDPDLEMAMLAENEVRYATLTQVAGRQFRGLASAITGGR